MTAIAGFWNFGSERDAGERCAAMLGAQRIFGPEPAAIWQAAGQAFGSCQRSLLQEDKAGGSTCVGESGAVLVGDLRIDNREEIGERLSLTRSRVASFSDAELLVQALERWNETVLDWLEGDFAFGFWEPARRRLLLARDFASQRPLHYHAGREFFAFASMPSGLRVLRDIPRAADLGKVAEFLALLPDDDSRSFFAGISKVPQGGLVSVRDGQLQQRRFWAPQSEPIELRRAEQYEEALREHLDRAVRVRLRGHEGQVASHLSAGLDSASVTATAARIMAASGGRVVSFTAVPAASSPVMNSGRQILDEGPLAAASAAMHANVEHVLVPSEPISPIERLDRHFQLYQRPILNLVNFVWLDQIKDRIRDRGLSILLTGARGNLSISYSGLTLLGQLARSGRLLRLVRELAGLRVAGMPWTQVGTHMLGPFVPPALWRRLLAWGGRPQTLDAYSLIKPEAATRWDIAGRAAKAGKSIDQRPQLDSIGKRLLILRGVDHGNYNKGTLAGWGIDTRDPTADRRLVEFCLRVPDDQYLHNGVARSLVRRAMADRLPREVLEERRKGRQASDWKRAFHSARSAIAEEVHRIADTDEAEALVDTKRMVRLMSEWSPDRFDESTSTRQYRLGLLRGLAAADFARRASGSDH